MFSNPYIHNSLRYGMEMFTRKEEVKPEVKEKSGNERCADFNNELMKVYDFIIAKLNANYKTLDRKNYDEFLQWYDSIYNEAIGLLPKMNPYTRKAVSLLLWTDMIENSEVPVRDDDWYRDEFGFSHIYPNVPREISANRVVQYFEHIKMYGPCRNTAKALRDSFDYEETTMIQP